MCRRCGCKKKQQQRFALKNRALGPCLNFRCIETEVIISFAVIVYERELAELTFYQCLGHLCGADPLLFSLGSGAKHRSWWSVQTPR